MDKRALILLACLLIFSFLVAVDATSVITAVSIITADLRGSTTESFWIGASYLLAMCISQPILSDLTGVFARTSTSLLSILLFGSGSLLCADAGSMIVFLAGRCVQGLGAGGLTMLSYMAMGDLEHKAGLRYLSILGVFIAAGTVCGPLLGAVLGNKHTWRWIFRLNIPICIVLGILVFNSGGSISSVPPNDITLSDLDFVTIVLFTTSVVPLLVGMSIGGSLYEWTDWRTIAPIALGCVFFALFVTRELRPHLLRFLPSKRSTHPKPLLDIRAFSSPHQTATFIGAMVLGMVMYTLLFFLPIYYQVIKEHNQTITGVLLFPQTLAIAPCAGIVLVLVSLMGVSYRWIVVSGWLCTACGIAALTALGAQRSVPTDIALNAPSGIGLGILMPALALCAQEGADDDDAVHAPVLLVFMRYLGSAFGLIAAGIVFQHALRHSLRSTEFHAQADEMTRYATTLMRSVRGMADSREKEILREATEDSLRFVWTIMAGMCFAILGLSCFAILPSSGRADSRQEGASTKGDDIPPPLEPSDDVASPRSPGDEVDEKKTQKL